jgi:HD-GYP domain-containing protein (c-di-GMP phosphodiesterase class II)
LKTSISRFPFEQPAIAAWIQLDFQARATGTQMNEHYDEHYINSVTALGDVQEVVTTQAIFTRSGIKLIDRGAYINSALREKLVQHKLIPSIDESLSVADCVTNVSLRERAREILDSEPRFQSFSLTRSETERLFNAFYAMPLNAPLAFKLTVAREQRPEIFEHSVQMTLIALILAIKSQLSDQDLASVAAAGMFHDIGELHIDPALLRSALPLDPDALRHVYAHPMTAYLILQSYPQFHPEISTPVFEHHERRDGSGYPRGIKGDEISRLGQILMLAEAVNTLFEKSWHTHGPSRLAVMLKMNRRKFDPGLINHLVKLLSGGEQLKADSPNDASSEAIAAQLKQLAELFLLWHRTLHACPPEVAEESLVVFVNQRLTDLERTLLETGFQPDELAKLTAGIENDDDALAEIQLMTSESRRQAGDILKEVRRRCAALRDDSAGRTAVEDWAARSETLLTTS